MRRITLGAVSFASGERLVLGAFLIIAYLARCFFHKKPSLPFSLLGLLPLQAQEPRRVTWGERGLIVMILSVAILILAQPQSMSSSEQVRKAGIDIVLALDISQSMLADDFQPNRLEAAKEVLQGFLDELQTDRVSMVVFAGKPFISVPLTFDYAIFKDILERTTVDTINQQLQAFQGTAIGDALLSSLTILQKGREDVEGAEQREQVIVLLTDGVANAGVQPVVVGKAAYEQHVKVYTVGIGSEAGGYITYETPFGLRRQQVEGVDEQTLQQLATDTGGRYRRATDEETFQEIFQELQRLEQHEIESEEKVLYHDIQDGFLLVLMILSGLMMRLFVKGRQVDEY